MKEQLITFETAKLAKEKGFDWGVLFSYAIYNKNLCSISAKRGFPTKNCNTYNTRYSAPMQSLLQKWLREIHNLVVEINVCSEYGWVWDLYKTDGTIINELHRGKIETYEEALETGLQEALKLINDDKI